MTVVNAMFPVAVLVKGALMASDELFRSVNPATEIVEREFSPHSAAEISDRLSQATLAFREWRTRSVPERGELLRALAGQMRLSQDAHARLMTVEMGKPWQQSLAEIEKCARTCEFYAEHGPRMLAPQTVEGNAALSSQVRFEPLGVVLAVMPWNFPYWQVVRFAAPALLAGNAGVLKHATNVLGCAEALEQLFHDAGFPPGVFTSLRVGRDHVSRLIQDDRIQAVTLTGSEAAGREVAAAAGQAIKKSVLELGGSDPFIVLADADLERTLDRAVEARTINNGQSCIAAKRFIVHRDVYAAFVEGLSARMLTLPVGDPLEPATKIGPLARQDLRETLHQQVRASLKEGAQLCTGGRPVDRRGWFYQPGRGRHSGAGRR
jgi:succinate-semialdehyde dehydrogenase/glutarate-semialdehyde dehydrogenase